MVEVADVHIWGELVGVLRWSQSQGLGSYQHTRAVRELGWDLAPLMMPLRQEFRVFSFPGLRPRLPDQEDTFKGLPGMLADALPDRYGHQLMNVWLARQGRPENSMNPVERLCFIGSRGMGALEFFPPRVTAADEAFEIELNSLVIAAGQLLSERSAFMTNMSEDEEKAIIDILKVGTSAGGARPKAVIAYHKETGEVRSGQGNVPEGFEHWLLKMDGVSDVQLGDSMGWGRVEYAYYLMARDCGIDIHTSQLLEEHGRAHFMTKRFDRDGNIRHHVQTLCGIQHYDYNLMDAYSYEQVFQTMRSLRLTYPEAEEMFRRMVFNVLASNCDDHTKNFSFMMKKDERWTLAPAYDLCFAYDEQNHWVNQQTLSVNGKRHHITKADMLIVAKANSVKKGKAIIERIREVVERWEHYAEKAGVSESLSTRISKRLRAVQFYK